jgi:hypothetical protein
MNIFVLHESPQKSAQMQCDKHVVKMILETAQMLCTVASQQGCPTPYRATHAKHPCTIWTSQSSANWWWLIDHGIALCEEYTRRYNKIHKSQKVIEYCKTLRLKFPRSTPTPFAQAMPQQYKHVDPVKAYRAYYKGEKSAFATWKTEVPNWWGE